MKKIIILTLCLCLLFVGCGASIPEGFTEDADKLRELLK